MIILKENMDSLLINGEHIMQNRPNQELEFSKEGLYKQIVIYLKMTQIRTLIFILHKNYKKWE